MSPLGRAYLSVIAARQRVLLQYRAAALAGVVTQAFWGALKLMVLAAFYRVGKTEPPMAFADVVAYVWLGQALFALLPWNADDDLVQQVRSGGVAFDLLRPLDLYGYWFARTLAFRTGRTLLRSGPIAVLAAVVLPLVGLDAWALAPPPSLQSGLAFSVSLVATVLLATAITMLLQVSLLRALSGAGVQSVLPAMVTVFSGMIVPLPLYPDFLQPLLQIQPLRGLCDVPFRIYTGHIAPPDAVLEVAVQLGWSVALIALGRALLAAATRRVVIQGG